MFMGEKFKAAKSWCKVHAINFEIEYNPLAKCITIRAFNARNGKSYCQPLSFDELCYRNYVDLNDSIIKALDGHLLEHPVHKELPTYSGIIPRNSGRYFTYDPLEMEKVIFNDPATIVIWKDGTKTVVKAEDENFDPEKGLAMCISKKVLGNKGNYYNLFRKNLPGDDKKRQVRIGKAVRKLKARLLCDILAQMELQSPDTQSWETAIDIIETKLKEEM